MAERQKHGFIYESEIIKRYNLIPSNDYTAKWDAYYNNIPVSIKLKQKGGNVELADLFRQASISEDFILVVGFWEKEKK